MWMDTGLLQARERLVGPAAFAVRLRGGAVGPVCVCASHDRHMIRIRAHTNIRNYAPLNLGNK